MSAAPALSPPLPAPWRGLLDRLGFAESPRWHDGRLWCSDFAGRTVLSVDPARGDVRIEHRLRDAPSGLGWRPDGTLLVVGMERRRLLAARPGGRLRAVAELAPFVGGPCNDMVVDGWGRAWVGNFGFDLHAKATPQPTVLLRVDPDGRVQVVADGLAFPNGMLITPDGATLIVAETFAARLTAFDIGADGGLSRRRVFADLPGVAPDGLALDADGAVWVADARGRRVLHVHPQRGVLREVSTGMHGSYACMLGGADGRDLFVCCAPDFRPVAWRLRAGRLAVTRVDVPRAGWP